MRGAMSPRAVQLTCATQFAASCAPTSWIVGVSESGGHGDWGVAEGVYVGIGALRRVATGFAGAKAPARGVKSSRRASVRTSMSTAALAVRLTCVGWLHHAELNPAQLSSAQQPFPGCDEWKGANKGSVLSSARFPLTRRRDDRRRAQARVSRGASSADFLLEEDKRGGNGVQECWGCTDDPTLSPKTSTVAPGAQRSPPCCAVP